MANCHEIELGQDYVREECGLQLKVVSEGEEYGAGTCGCTAPAPSDAAANP
jgi:hypothetical protein